MSVSHFTLCVNDSYQGEKLVASTTPNKEIIRRICHLNGATKCHLFVATGDEFAEVLTDIPTDKIASCITELEQWAGIKFRLFNFKNNKDDISNILSKGEIILPIKF